VNRYVLFWRHYCEVVYVVPRAAMLNVFNMMDLVASVFTVALWPLSEGGFAIS